MKITEQDVLEAQIKALGIKHPQAPHDLYAICVEFCKREGRAPMTDDLRSRVKIPETTFRRAIDRLVKEGRMLKCLQANGRHAYIPVVTP